MRRVIARVPLLIAVLGISGCPGAFRSDSIERQWRENIEALGIVPLFPPREDVVVGDLFRVLDSDGGDGTGSDRRALLYATLGDIKALALDHYGERVEFNRSAAITASSTPDAARVERQPSAGKTTDFHAAPGAFRPRQVAFPGYSFASVGGFELGAPGTGLGQPLSGALTGGSTNRVDVSVPVALSYSLPLGQLVEKHAAVLGCRAAGAENARTEDAVGLAFPKRSGTTEMAALAGGAAPPSGYVGDGEYILVQEVYLARTIDYRYRNARVAEAALQVFAEQSAAIGTLLDLAAEPLVEGPTVTMPTTADAGDQAAPTPVASQGAGNVESTTGNAITAAAADDGVPDAPVVPGPDGEADNTSANLGGPAADIAPDASAVVESGDGANAPVADADDELAVPPVIAGTDVDRAVRDETAEVIEGNVEPGEPKTGGEQGAIPAPSDAVDTPAPSGEPTLPRIEELVRLARTEGLRLRLLSASGGAITLQRTFDRPVAIGYRGIEITARDVGERRGEGAACARAILSNATLANVERTAPFSGR